ncbi:MAG: PaaI family thioesterase [Actinobacteria bacterium]|nr:PaaI family thioesterase [Actinomycetota bacterium]
MTQEVWQEPVRGGAPDPRMFGLSGLEQLNIALEGGSIAPPIHHLTGLRPTEFGIGSATFILPASPWFQSAAGIFLSGISAFAADAPLGTSIYTTLPAATPLITSELSMSFLRPATVESQTIIARGRLVHGGSRVGLSEVMVEDSAGRMLAHGSSRCFIFPQLEPVPERPKELEPVEPQVYETPDPYLRDVVPETLSAEVLEQSSGLEITKAHVEGKLARPAWARLFGARTVEAEEGKVTLTMPVTGWVTSGMGTLYGGATALFADAALLTSVYTTLPEDTATATLDIKVQYVRPAYPGTDLVARAQVVHRGRTLAVANCEISNSEGKLIALATGSTIIIPGRKIEAANPVIPADEGPDQEAD